MDGPDTDLSPLTPDDIATLRCLAEEKRSTLAGPVARALAEIARARHLEPADAYRAGHRWAYRVVADRPAPITEAAGATQLHRYQVLADQAAERSARMAGRRDGYAQALADQAAEAAVDQLATARKRREAQCGA